MHGDTVIGGVPGAADIVGDHRIFDNDIRVGIIEHLRRSGKRQRNWIGAAAG